jgi:hypothetical protein
MADCIDLPTDAAFVEIKHRDNPWGNGYKCRRDYEKSAADGDYDKDRYGKTYNFVRSQTVAEGDDGYSLNDGLFDNYSLLFAEMYGKSTHLKSEGMADNSRFRWNGSRYCKGPNTVVILESPHYQERLQLKAEGKITNNVQEAEKVPSKPRRKRLTFGLAKPGEQTDLVHEEDNTYYVKSLHNRYQVALTNPDTALDISQNGTNLLPSLRTFKLKAIEPDATWQPGGGGVAYEPVTAWMSDINQKRYWEHIEFFSTRNMPVGKTKHEAESETEALSERRLFANETISSLQ